MSGSNVDTESMAPTCGLWPLEPLESTESLESVECLTSVEPLASEKPLGFVEPSGRWSRLRLQSPLVVRIPLGSRSSLEGLRSPVTALYS